MDTARLAASSPASPAPGPRLQVTHFALHFHTLGGLQSMLQHQLANDARWGNDSRVVVFFEGREMPERADTRLLGLTWRHSIADARRRIRDALDDRPTDVAVYHDVWGLPFAADLDRAERRVGMVVCPIAPVFTNLAQNADLLDGVLCIGQPSVDMVRRSLPGWPPERLHWVPVPVATVERPAPHPSLRGRPFVLGYSGRLEKPLKRVDRLPGLLQALERAGLDVRLELLGEGPARPWLGRAFGRSPRVRFHGRQSGPAYWTALRGWDAIVYVSDAEAIGIALLEAMSVGVLPFYPRIDGGGEPYVRAVHPDFVFAPDDFGHVARTVRALCAAPDAEVAALRARCREVVAPHLGDGYEASFSAFVREVRRLPRISRVAFGPRPFYVTDRWPFALIQRVYPRALWRNRPTPAAAPRGPA
jgi:glycosyltransferase involved in cell wall biosynthesis